ncbi:thioredoxin-domain-containing protein [Cucurbitaria berberidis CBS 394.84]|uniref:Thioredoxin-domain-containing protein n=1 Tax=Cucurbitaria berberidis CBS 394.84 TaxID=1168544 RepID=A0A9P4GIS7_9PLEO|nr:thioredoxin-domain-containing protein [Cucurbitaria berberidis CBS 394.84]KAF1846943.1 thioredoxin-domain-containing protein [Cucurbitaria berberidis CBS 394.84]
MPTEISAPLHFRTLLNAHTYLIADFYATWCPPCKQIAPIYDQLSTSYSAAGKFAFVKVNVDEQREIAAQHGVTAMPTFLVFKDGKKVEEIRGADPRKLKAAVEKASEALKSAQTTLPAKPKQADEPKVADEKKQDWDEKTVSGGYGMTGGNEWKMSLH